MSDQCRSGEDCPHAEESAKKAVKMVFAILGVDVDSPKEVEEFRENLRFGATLRRAADKGWMAIAGAVAIGMASAVWVGVGALMVDRCSA